jgi:hypothetical protein
MLCATKRGIFFWNCCEIITANRAGRAAVGGCGVLNGAFLGGDGSKLPFSYEVPDA